jgi:hypothetical protein
VAFPDRRKNPVIEQGHSSICLNSTHFSDYHCDLWRPLVAGAPAPAAECQSIESTDRESRVWCSLKEAQKSNVIEHLSDIGVVGWLAWLRAMLVSRQSGQICIKMISAMKYA